MLNALRGVRVSVAGATPMTGRILHAEPPPDAAAAAPRGRTRVTLLTDAGLQQFVLEDVASVQVADPVLRGRLMAALAALRGSAASDRRRLSVAVDGAGPRRVHLGMVIGAPLWKASYRLMLADPAPPDPAPPDGAATGRLQGWAVLENAGLEDWTGISLTLQAGSLVAFRQAIYDTYYVARPFVPVDMLQHPAPPADTRAAPLAAAGAPLMLRQMQAPAAAMAAGPAPGPAPGLAAPAQPVRAAEHGVTTSFTLPHPLSLAAGHSAAVPFLDRAVTATPLDLLAAGAAHPLAAVRLVNDTGLGLPPGVVATYGAGGFSGDARLGPLPSGESRVLSFAKDLATTAAWHTGAAASIAAITAAQGVLHLTRRERTTTTIDLHAPAAAPRRVLVDVPRHGDATLSTEPVVPAEQTATAWRLDVALRAGEQRRIVAHADRLVQQSTVLGDDPGRVVAVLGEQGLPDAARAALQRVAQLQRDAAARQADSERLQAQRTTIEQDETRLRANLAAVPASDALHGQLLRGLAADEDRLASLAASQQRADAASGQAARALDDAVSSLSF